MNKILLDLKVVYYSKPANVITTLILKLLLISFGGSGKQEMVLWICKSKSSSVGSLESTPLWSVLDKLVILFQQGSAQPSKTSYLPRTVVFPSATDDWFEPQPTKAILSSFEESLTLIFLHHSWSPGIAQQAATVLCLQLKRKDKVNIDGPGDKMWVSPNKDQFEKDAQEDTAPPVITSCHKRCYCK